MTTLFSAKTKHLPGFLNCRHFDAVCFYGAHSFSRGNHASDLKHAQSFCRCVAMFISGLGMRNSTGSPLFSDFKSDQSDISSVVRFRPLVNGNEDPGYEGGLQRRLATRRTALWVNITICLSLHDLSCRSELRGGDRRSVKIGISCFFSM